MPTRDEKRRQDINKNKKKNDKEGYPVVVDGKDDMSDPVKGLTKARG